ncbi:MAG: putative permease, superfamily [Nocardioidaceae bacterium]|nr:putative permease, superfamily [Nocardioidaceae bacterium]
MPAVIVTWGLGPPATALVSAPPMTAVVVRFSMSVVVMTVLLVVSGKRPRFLRSRLALPAGLLFGLNNAAFFFSVQHASIAVVSVIFALQPAVVLLCAGRFLDEVPTRWHLCWTAVAIAGTGAVVAGEDPQIGGDVLGIALAALAMLALTGYHVISRLARSRTEQPVDAVQWMADVTLVAWIALIPTWLATTSPGSLLDLTTRDLALVAFIAIVVGVVGHTLMSWIHKSMPANRSAVYLLLFNVVAVLVGWLVNDQPLTVPQVIGGAVVLVGAGAVAARPPRSASVTAVNTIVDSGPVGP